MSDFMSKPMRKRDMLLMLGKWLPDKVKDVEDDLLYRFDGCRVLLVEDNVTNRILAEELLSEAGFEHEHAENGEIACQKAKAGGYDLILMDVQMPVMDGLTATKHIRTMIADEEMADLPIIALTANAMKGVREQCLEAGMNDYISKPYKKRDLNTMIAKWIEPRVGDAGEGQQGLSALDENIFNNYRTVLGEDYAAQVQSYLHNAKHLLTHIETAWAQEDLAVLKLSAFSLRTASSSMGIIELAKSCKALQYKADEILEYAGGFDDMDDDMLANVQDSMARAEKLLRGHMNQNEQGQ